MRLRAKLEDLTISAGEKTKTQLLKARDERNNTIKKMSQELNELQLVSKLTSYKIIFMS